MPDVLSDDLSDDIDRMIRDAIEGEWPSGGERGLRMMIRGVVNRVLAMHADRVANRLEPISSEAARIVREMRFRP